MGILSLNTSSRATSPIPSNTQNLILNLSLTIPMLPHHLLPSMSLLMNHLTLSQLITRNTQSQAPSRTTHLNKNHTTHHTNHRRILNHLHTTPHRTSITPTLS